MNEMLLFTNFVMLLMTLVFYFSARSGSRHTRDWKNLAGKWKEAYELWRGVAEKYEEVVKVYLSALASGIEAKIPQPEGRGIAADSPASASEGTPKGFRTFIDLHLLSIDPSAPCSLCGRTKP